MIGYVSVVKFHVLYNTTILRIVLSDLACGGIGVASHGVSVSFTIYGRTRFKAGVLSKGPERRMRNAKLLPETAA